MDNNKENVLYHIKYEKIIAVFSILLIVFAIIVSFSAALLLIISAKMLFVRIGLFVFEALLLLVLVVYLLGIKKRYNDELTITDKGIGWVYYGRSDYLSWEQIENCDIKKSYGKNGTTCLLIKPIDKEQISIDLRGFIFNLESLCKSVNKGYADNKMKNVSSENKGVTDENVQTYEKDLIDYEKLKRNKKIRIFIIVVLVILAILFDLVTRTR